MQARAGRSSVQVTGPSRPPECSLLRGVSERVGLGPFPPGSIIVRGMIMARDMERQACAGPRDDTDRRSGTLTTEATRSTPSHSE